jgi:hypothetical protein
MDAPSSEHAVIVEIEARGFWKKLLLSTQLWKLEDKLSDALETSGAGEFDGNEIGEDDATLFMYGPDAGRLFSVIEGTLRKSWLCRGARVRLRSGPPGAAERELRL